ncbi:pentatricopeptide repeat-containing protein At4g01030, mitochondrial [Punica granatum]|uniref:DYW domain-containing protein n=2 Tax=Punica granatum TaxID=22663 RepID=A0A218W9A7_PUNGR|nr:pentatricopeptide repeat-containing protein At4g01030, mitochondrial [Punica granatum]OWM68662.1 hypothetical protein CDL15_Pgr023627 [Punica granatum]PKI76668.1 hypothetical protein CRG98_002977 [Punica granatum]
METLPPLHHRLNLLLHQNPRLRSHSLAWAAVGVSPLPPLRPALLGDLFTEVKSLDSLKMIHAQMIKSPERRKYDENLLACYMDFGDVRSAAVLLLLGGFGRSHDLLLEECRRDRALSRRVLKVFGDLHHKGISFGYKTYVLVLIICTAVLDSLLGLEIHACLMKSGLMFDVVVQRALLIFYEKCWGIERADQLLEDLPQSGDLARNEIIKLNVKNERWVRALELFRDMQFSYAMSNDTTIARMLQACGKLKALSEGKQIHGHVLRHSLQSNLSICNALINMYTKNEELELARKVFDSMEDRNLTSWNCIISAYALLGHFDDAWDRLINMESHNIRPDIITWNCLLRGLSVNGLYGAVLTIFQRMQSEGFRPTSSSVTSALQSVIQLGLLNHGKEIHGYVIRHGLDYDVYVGTSLVDMYVKSDCLPKAQSVFGIIRSRNVFAWNCLLSGYSFKGLFEDAQSLLNQMVDAGMRPDLVTYNCLLSGYSMWGHTDKALYIMQEIKRSGLIPNVVSWTALISGCSQKGNHNEALEIFIEMQRWGIEPNAATISCLLRSCGGLSLLHKGKEIHCISIKSGMIKDAFVATATVDMYSKSGNLSRAIKVFRRIEKKPLAAWNCMIMGFATYSRGKEAISLFHEMCAEGISPDSITFTALLSGCKSSGLVTEGWNFFDRMSRDYDVNPTAEHYCCMVDLLGRAGYLDEAWDFIQKMALRPDASIWGSLLCASRIHKNVEYAEIAAKHLFKLEPHNSANYILMINLYAMSNRWKDVENVRDLMSRLGVRNGQTWSWISIDGNIHYFSAEESSHPEAGEIYFELYQLFSEIRKLAYVPDTSCVYQKVEDEAEKEKLLLSHTEKMAIVYGLMKSRSNTPIRVIKNSRVCSDCHNAAKYISIARNREIFIKDGARFHHFREGECSCKDCW